MITDMTKRSYTLKKRARSRQATRDRIVEALMALHEELGPRNTTISAIAERAGVQRLTVYRHFPDETELLQACTSRWLEMNPPPDPEDWSTIGDGVERTRAALRALYRYFRSTERMWSVSFRDEAEVPALQAPMKAFRDYLAAIASDLLQALGPEKTAAPGVAATIEHAVEYQTWASLAARGADDAQAAALATTWVRAVLHQQSDGDAAPAQLAGVSVVVHDDSGAPVLEGTAALRPARHRR
jgi:AcrR family transcriptional regulator